MSLLFQGNLITLPAKSWLSHRRLGPITSALFMHLELKLQYQETEAEVP